MKSPSMRILGACVEIWDILDSGWFVCGEENLSQKLMRREQLCDPSSAAELCTPVATGQLCFCSP